MIFEGRAATLTLFDDQPSPEALVRGSLLWLFPCLSRSYGRCCYSEQSIFLFRTRDFPREPTTLRPVSLFRRIDFPIPESRFSWSAHAKEDSIFLFQNRDFPRAPTTLRPVSLFRSIDFPVPESRFSERTHHPTAGVPLPKNRFSFSGIAIFLECPCRRLDFPIPDSQFS